MNCLSVPALASSTNLLSVNGEKVDWKSSPGFLPIKSPPVPIYGVHFHLTLESSKEGGLAYTSGMWISHTPQYVRIVVSEKLRSGYRFSFAFNSSFFSSFPLQGELVRSQDLQRDSRIWHFYTSVFNPKPKWEIIKLMHKRIDNLSSLQEFWESTVFRIHTSQKELK